jgi:hypothetical protein
MVRSMTSKSHILMNANARFSYEFVNARPGVGMLYSKPRLGGGDAFEFEGESQKVNCFVDGSVIR